MQVQRNAWHGRGSLSGYACRCLLSGMARRWEGRGPVVASIRIRLVWIFCYALDARESGAGPSGQDREQTLTTWDFVKRGMLKAA